MKISAVLMKYRWIILVVVIIAIGGAVYAQMSIKVIKQEPGVMHGPENHPLNVELAEINEKQTKCLNDLNKKRGKDESYRPTEFFESIEYASTCISVADLARVAQIQSELQKMSSKE